MADLMPQVPPAPGADDASATDDPATDPLMPVLAQAIEPLAAPPAVVRRMRQRLLERVHAAAVTPPEHFELPCAEPQHSPGIVVVRANDQGWVDLLPGVRAKLLFSDGRAETVLLDCDAGAVLFSHGHEGIEECLVMRGAVEFDDGLCLAEGDYQLALDGSRHARGRTPVPTLLMLKTSQPIHSYMAR